MTVVFIIIMPLEIAGEGFVFDEPEALLQGAQHFITLGTCLLGDAAQRYSGLIT